MALIRNIAGLKSGRVYELDSGTIVFGRNPRQCDVVLDHFAVSREHARITLVDGIAYIEDLESRNGVLVNGQVIAAGSAGRKRLYSGDNFRIATFEFIYEEDPSSDVKMSDRDSAGDEVLSKLDVSDDNSGVETGLTNDTFSAILAVLQELPTAPNPSRVLSSILDHLFGAFKAATMGAIFLRRNASEDFVPAAVRRRAGVTGPVVVQRTLLDAVASQKSALLTIDHGSASNGSHNDLADLPSRSIVCVPLIWSDEVLGVIQLESPREAGEFTSRDLAVLGGVARHLAAVILTSRRHIEALQAQQYKLEQRFRDLIEGAVQGVLVHRQFRPLFVNRTFARLYGYTVEEILGLSTVEPLLSQDDQERLLVCGTDVQFEPIFPLRYETQGCRKDGSTFWLEKFITLVDWVDGPAFQTAVFDVTDRKQAEDGLRRAHRDLEQRVTSRTAELANANSRLEKEVADRQHKEEDLERSNRELEQFAYSVSHDLHSPLRTITNYCQLLQSQAAGKLTVEELDFLETAVQSARRMERLLDDLLSYSRVSIATSNFHPCDANLAVREARRNLQAVSAEAGASIECDPLPTVFGDPAQLMVLFQNLLSNSIAYRRNVTPRIHISARELPEVWEFLVQDNGAGIPPDQYGRIFQVLQRVHREDDVPGSGLGLAICKRIVERHGGRIWVESVVGEGSTFHFTIARTPEP
jgi:PAS domain S-box-containing protein